MPQSGVTVQDMYTLHGGCIVPDILLTWRKARPALSCCLHIEHRLTEDTSVMLLSDVYCLRLM